MKCHSTAVIGVRDTTTPKKGERKYKKTSISRSLAAIDWALDRSATLELTFTRPMKEDRH